MTESTPAAKPADDVLYTELPDGESVLLHLGTEEYFGLNELGTAVWAALQVGDGLAQMIEETAAATGTPVATVTSDVDALLEQLVANGLATR